MEWLALIAVVGFILWQIGRGWARPDEPIAYESLAAILPEEFIVIDLETTGLRADRHKIIEIAAIRYRHNSTRHDTLRALIKINGKVPAKITSITGITSAMLEAEGEPLEAALPQFLEFIGNRRLVSYNAEFDMAFLEAALGRRVNNPVSCALKMARRAWPGRKSYKLSVIARSQDAAVGAHRALNDCQLALTVYVAAVAKLRTLS